MAQETKQTQAPLLCATGCGFYGNPRTNGMCSVCYKDSLQRQNSNGRASPAVSSGSNFGETLSSVCSLNNMMPSATPTEQSSLVPSQSPVPSPAVTHSASEQSGSSTGLKTEEVLASELEPSAQSSTDEADRTGESTSKPKRNRCFTCRKKVGLTGFDCRCGNVFCGAHRYSDIHNCTFDYKAEAAERIRKDNPIIVGEKIQKI